MKCIFCQTETNRTYRNTTIHHPDFNLISACKDCITKQNQTKPDKYLISCIYQEKSPVEDQINEQA